MYVCMYRYVFFISQPQQHKSKHKNTIKAEKKKTAVKNDIHCIQGWDSNFLRTGSKELQTSDRINN